MGSQICGESVFFSLVVSIIKGGDGTLASITSREHLVSILCS